MEKENADQRHSLDDLNKNCLEEFTRHWKCLDNHNQQMWQCRPFEWKLNQCAFEKIVRPLPRRRVTKQWLT